MAFTWLRPVDQKALEGRPLLDLGTGDGQTLTALIGGHGLVVGLDRSLEALRAAGQTGVPCRVCADAGQLPFADGSFQTVIAADLFHHLDDDGLASVLGEINRVLGARGTLVAWWYQRPGREASDSPRYPRSFSTVESAAQRAGLAGISTIELQTTLETPSTVGLSARSR